MARLIIGHTTHNSARVWIRGHQEYPVGFVTVSGPGGPYLQRIELECRHGYTGIVDYKGLRPRERYDCFVRFGKTKRDAPIEHIDFGHCQGQFRTFPATDAKSPLKFLFGSCNFHSLDLLQSPDESFRRLARITEEE